MPLVILGLFVIVGIVLYALVRYGESGEADPRSVRERYPHAFPPKKNIFDAFNDPDEEELPPDSESSDHTMYFPEDAELEKRKRNIH